MTKVKPEIESLVLTELYDAIEKFPMFHSRHEAYAVLLEEVEEAKKQLDCVVMDLESVWANIRTNAEWKFIGNRLSVIKKNAVGLAVEAVQIATMCQKFQMSCGDAEG